MAAYFPSPDEVLAISRTPTIVHFSFQFDDATAATTFTVPVKAGMFVHEVCTFVSEAFDTSGSAASLVIGDGSSSAGYLAAADTVLGTIDTATKSSKDGGEAYAFGKYYSADDTIDFAFTPASAGGTAGKVVGFVVLSSVRLDGIPSAAAAA